MGQVAILNGQAAVAQQSHGARSSLLLLF